MTEPPALEPRLDAAQGRVLRQLLLRIPTLDQTIYRQQLGHGLPVGLRRMLPWDAPPAQLVPALVEACNQWVPPTDFAGEPPLVVLIQNARDLVSGTGLADELTAFLAVVAPAASALPPPRLPHIALRPRPRRNTRGALLGAGTVGLLVGVALLAALLNASGRGPLPAQPSATSTVLPAAVPSATAIALSPTLVLSLTPPPTDSMPSVTLVPPSPTLLGPATPIPSSQPSATPVPPPPAAPAVTLIDPGAGISATFTWTGRNATTATCQLDNNPLESCSVSGSKSYPGPFAWSSRPYRE